MESFKRGLRATGRLFKGIGLVAGVAWNVYVRRADEEKLKELSHKFYNDLKDLFGIKIVFNSESAPIEEDNLAWYVANHMSVADFIVLGSVLKRGTFAGKELKLPEKLLGVAKYIGIPRVNKTHPDFELNNNKTRGRIAQNFNDDQSTIMFPEGTITDGSQVALFRAGLLNLLFEGGGLDKDANPVELESKVMVQPIGIRVVDVEGKSVDERPELRHYYSHFSTLNPLKRIWTRMATESVTIELKVFDAVDPDDFENGIELANHAGALIRAFAAPHQTVVEKAKIPGVAERGEENEPPTPQRGLY